MTKKDNKSDCSEQSRQLLKEREEQDNSSTHLLNTNETQFRKEKEKRMTTTEERKI